MDTKPFTVTDGEFSFHYTHALDALACGEAHFLLRDGVEVWVLGPRGERLASYVPGHRPAPEAAIPILENGPGLRMVPPGGAA